MVGFAMHGHICLRHQGGGGGMAIAMHVYIHAYMAILYSITYLLINPFETLLANLVPAKIAGLMLRMI